MFLEDLGIVGWESIEPQIITALYLQYPLLLVGNHGSNKAQPLHCKIKIPNGWKQMGEMVVGDVVCTSDGKTANVTGVFPQGIKEVYRISFEDGRTTECCKDHLWKVFSDGWRYVRKNHKIKGKAENSWRILQLRQIMEHKNKRGLFIPLPTNVYGEQRELPLNPYILGLLLGDGSFSQLGGNVSFSCYNDATLERFRQGLQEGYSFTPSSSKRKGDYVITNKANKGGGKPQKGAYTNFYKKVLNNLKLLGCNSYTKFVPENYKETSFEQRLELLRGLMDTDGWASDSVGFASSSHKLALDVQYLVRSLGGLCSITINKSTYIYKGVKKQGKISFRCNIRHETPEILFKDPLKREQAKRVQQITLKNKIKSIKYLGEMACQCIKVDHSDHLYITDNFVVTHNTESCGLLAKAALGETANFAAFDTPYLQFEDMIGFINPSIFAQTEVCTSDAFVRTPFSIWGKDAVLLDELTLVNPIIQGKLNELVRKRTIMGIPTGVKLIFAAANPPDTYDTMRMPVPLASRFAIVEVPSTKSMSPKTLSKLLSKEKNGKNVSLKACFDKADKEAPPDPIKVSNLILDIVAKFKSAGHMITLEGRTLITMQDFIIAFCKLKVNPLLKFKTVSDLPEVLLSLIPEVSSVVNRGTNKASVLAILKDAVANFDLNAYSLTLPEYIKSGESLDSLVFQHECLKRIEKEEDPAVLFEALRLLHESKLSNTITSSIISSIKVKRYLAGVDLKMPLDSLITKIMKG